MNDRKTLTARVSSDLQRLFGEAVGGLHDRNSMLNRIRILSASLELNREMVYRDSPEYLVARHPELPRRKKLHCGYQALDANKEVYDTLAQFKLDESTIRCVREIETELKPANTSMIIRWAMHTVVIVTPYLLEGWKLGIIEGPMLREFASFDNAIKPFGGIPQRTSEAAATVLQTPANASADDIRELLCGSL